MCIRDRVTISADGKLYEITTRADTVAEAVEAAGIVLGAEDKVNYDLSCSVDEVVGIVTVSRPLTLTVNLANDRRIITTYSDNVSDALAENDIPFDESKDIILGAEDGAVCDGDEITIEMCIRDSDRSGRLAAFGRPGRC